VVSRLSVEGVGGYEDCRVLRVEKEPVGEDEVTCGHFDICASVENGIAEEAGRCSGVLWVQVVVGVLTAATTGRGGEERTIRKGADGWVFCAEEIIGVIAAEGMPGGEGDELSRIVRPVLVVAEEGSEDEDEPFPFACSG
jgi:hypothetical protein